MRSLGTAVLALLIATAAQAQELSRPQPEETRPAASLMVEAPDDPAAPELPAAEPNLTREQAPATPEAAEAVADPFRRGSFWWYVGIIVVAGVILAAVT